MNHKVTLSTTSGCNVQVRIWSYRDSKSFLHHLAGFLVIGEIAPEVAGLES